MTVVVGLLQIDIKLFLFFAVFSFFCPLSVLCNSRKLISLQQRRFTKESFGPHLMISCLSVIRAQTFIVRGRLRCLLVRGRVNLLFVF